MDKHSSLSQSWSFSDPENILVHPSDLVLTMIEDETSSKTSSLSSISSLNSPTTSNGSLSPSSSYQSLSLSSSSPMAFPSCLFRCRPNSHPFQERSIPLNEPVKVGRAVARLKALPNNAIFDCKVLSRQHAKLWYENGKFLLQDTKSSNGTFVNNQRLGKCNEESLPFEIFSGDIIQFGVDVTENNRKTTHNCIIIEVKLYHSDGNEALPRSANGQSLAQTKEVDISSQALYQLANYLQEAMHREQMLEQKLEYLQNVIRDTQQASTEGWQAIIDEDRLLARINTLEDQIRIYHSKHPIEDASTKELVQLQQNRTKFEEESKIKLEKAILERADAISRSRSLECSLQMAQEEQKRLEEQNERNKEDIQKLIQSLDEQRLLTVEFESKLRDSQSRCVELENERQRIQNDFENFYQQTQEAEKLQKQNAANNQNSEPIEQNGVNNDEENHGRFHVESTSNELQQPNNVDQHQDSSDNVEVESSLVSPNPSTEPTERDHRQTIIPTKATLIDEEISINHNHENDLTSVENPYPIDPVELFEARKQIETLRQNLQETNERLSTIETALEKEQERYRLVSSEYLSMSDEFVELKQRSAQEIDQRKDLIENHQNQLQDLTARIASKQSEHDQLLSIYLRFFLSCYLLIFFLFFALLSW